MGKNILSLIFIINTFYDLLYSVVLLSLICLTICNSILPVIDIIYIINFDHCVNYNIIVLCSILIGMEGLGFCALFCNLLVYFYECINHIVIINIDHIISLILSISAICSLLKFTLVTVTINVLVLKDNETCNQYLFHYWFYRLWLELISPLMAGIIVLFMISSFSFLPKSIITHDRFRYCVLKKIELMFLKFTKTIFIQNKMAGTIIDCFKGTAAGCGALILSILFIAVTFSGLALGIADVVIGAKWDDCYLNSDDADIYLIVSGSILIASFVFNILNQHSKKDKDNKGNYTGLLIILFIAFLGILIWGMTIVWDTDQGDCSKSQYDYLYYRTVVVMFINVTVFVLLLMAVFCGVCVNVAVGSHV